MKRMKRIMEKLYKEQSGVSMILVALGIFMLIGFTAIVVDVGGLYFEKSRLQKALDAAVLGGAQKLMLEDSTLSVSEAKSVAKDISKKNGYALADEDIDAVHKTHIKAIKQVNVPLTFAKVMGFNEATVTASAKAIVAGPLLSAGGIAPIAVVKSAVPNETTLTCKEGKTSPGNCGFLSVDGSGAPVLKEAIINGSKYSVGTDAELETEPGTMNGPIKEAVQDLIDSDKDKPHCDEPSTADNSCRRVIHIVVIETWEGVEGKDTVTVVGFAAFWIKEYDNKGSNKSIIGEFISEVTAGEAGVTGTESNFGLYGVKLVE